MIRVVLSGYSDVPRNAFFAKTASATRKLGGLLTRSFAQATTTKNLGTFSFPLRSSKSSERLVVDGKGWFPAQGVHTLFVNLLTIHNHFFGSADADAHFVASDFHDRYANIVADHDRFPDFSG
jgi:hypothetical protein